MIKSTISDTTHRKSAEVDITSGEKRALTVATRPLKVFDNALRFFSNDIYGIDLNKNASFGGTPVVIHQGVDDAQPWVASAIQGGGRWDFNSSDQQYAGTVSIDATLTINNDVAQFAKGSDQALTGYTAISGWIYVTGWPVTGTKQVLLLGWDTGTASIVGNSVDIGSYINKGTFGVWQQFAIPLADLGLTNGTIDSIRIIVIDSGAGAAPNYYLDDIQVEQTGAPIPYIIEPDTGTWLHIHEIKSIFIDALDTTLASATMPNLSYNKILALSALNIGILYQRTSENEIDFSFISRQLSDFLQVPGTSIVDVACDGTNTVLTLSFRPEEPLILKADFRDKMSVIINDDLTGLLSYRVSVAGKIETRV